MLPVLASKQRVLARSSSRTPWHRGDIVVFRNPVLRDRIYLKRIIGLPDEELRLQGDLIWVNGSRLEEPYIASVPSGIVDAQETLAEREWWLGADEFFLLSDNRLEGKDDSRAFGPVHRQLILGQVWFRYWPLRHWGILSRSG